MALVTLTAYFVMEIRCYAATVQQPLLESGLQTTEEWCF
jgi:hypothetical protein